MGARDCVDSARDSEFDWELEEDDAKDDVSSLETSDISLDRRGLFTSAGYRLRVVSVPTSLGGII